ncbi:MAG TPA: hypothetical protein V8P47_00010 [Candidatus Azosocius sp. HAIN]
MRFICLPTSFSDSRCLLFGFISFTTVTFYFFYNLSFFSFSFERFILRKFLFSLFFLPIYGFFLFIKYSSIYLIFLYKTFFFFHLNILSYALYNY